MIDTKELRRLALDGDLAAMQEIILRLEAAEKERDWHAERCEDAMNECDALRAKIAQMEKQEPVAFALYSGWAFKAAYHKEHEACDQRDRRQLSADLGGSLEAYRVVALYALPGAQPAPSVPDGWKLVPIEPTSEMLDKGSDQSFGYVSIALDVWAAMLAAAPEPNTQGEEK